MGPTASKMLHRVWVVSGPHSPRVSPFTLGPAVRGTVRMEGVAVEGRPM